MQLTLESANSDRSKLQPIDHLVGAGEEDGGDTKSERLCCFQIDHQIVLGRCLHRQICRFLALEDTINVPGGTAVFISGVEAVEIEPPSLA